MIFQKTTDKIAKPTENLHITYLFINFPCQAKLLDYGSNSLGHMSCDLFALVHPTIQTLIKVMHTSHLDEQTIISNEK